MDFNCWHPHRSNGVPKRYTGMGVGGGIENDYIEIPFCFLNPINQFTLKVGLSEVNFHTQVFGALADLGLNVSQSRVTVYIRFTFSQQVQIRAIKKQNLHAVWARLTRIFPTVELISVQTHTK